MDRRNVRQIIPSEVDWDSETLILDFLQDMLHMVLFYKMNPSKALRGELTYESILIDAFAELAGRLGHNPKELYN